MAECEDIEYHLACNSTGAGLIASFSLILTHHTDVLVPELLPVLVVLSFWLRYAVSEWASTGGQSGKQRGRVISCRNKGERWLQERMPDAHKQATMMEAGMVDLQHGDGRLRLRQRRSVAAPAYRLWL